MEERIDEVQCPTHGARKVRSYKLFTDWREPECDLCAQDKLIAEEKAEEAARLERERTGKERAILRNLERAAIPPRFDGRTLDNFTASTPEAVAALTTCREYADHFPERHRRGASLILSGNAGTGKTHLACGIAQVVITVHGKSAVYLTVGRAFRRVKDTYRKDSRKSEEEALRFFGEPDLLILDEIGVQYGSDAEKNILFEIVNERYEAMKPTILISNLAMASLTEYAGERVIDRMKENGGRLIVFDWKSHRGAA